MTRPKRPRHEDATEARGRGSSPNAPGTARPEPTPVPQRSFAARLLAWFEAHGRHDLPWQHPRTPYRVWLSEVMLQQTQVATVVPYFDRFVRELPTLAALAGAPLERVLVLWAGLGYYSRGRNLHRAAQVCVDRHGGELPREVEALAALPGIGRSTAAAIAAQAYGSRAAILDGNVRRVLARRHGVRGAPSSSAVQSILWSHAEDALPRERLADYTQAQMDLGATVCTPRDPACDRCPVASDCHAFLHGAQHELPTPRARLARPTRERWLLLAVDARDRVLCELRPPSGLWGGLLALPEFDEPESLQLAVAAWSSRPPDPAPLPSFTHAFTHYTLVAHPYLARIAAPRAIGDNRHRWIARDELDANAFPTPIRRLLADYWKARCPAPSTASA